MNCDIDDPRLPTPGSACSVASAPGEASLTVLYDGACPLCRREIALYRGAEASTPLRFADVNTAPAPALATGKTQAELLSRFHVVTADGRLLSGARAFVALWSTLPGWRWLARLARLPGAMWLLEHAYRVFLRLRPSLQRWAARLDARVTPARSR